MSFGLGFGGSELRSQLFLIICSQALVERAQELGLCTLVSFIGAIDPTSIVIAMVGSIAVNEAIYLNVSIPFPAWRCNAFRPRTTMTVGTQGFDSEHASQEILTKISSLSNLAT